MHYYPLLFIFTCLVQCGFSLLEVCNDAPWSLCSPRQNETWYHYNSYDFIWNQTSTFINSSDLYILTIAGQNGTERTIKSWFDLTGNALHVQVTDDWFPKSLPTGSSRNITWTVYGFVFPHNETFPADILNLPSMEALSHFEPNTRFNVIQTATKPIIITREKFRHKWILAIIIVACLIVIIAICVIIWAWRNMQNMKKKSKNTNPYQQDIQSHNKMQQQQQSSILSTPDAMMIADTFRQVMSTSDLDKSRNQVGKDLLTRQLMSEGTSVSQVERRTSSTKN